METHTVPKVELVGITVIRPDTMSKYMGLGFESDSDLLAEFGGRGCYDAYDKPREETRQNAAYLDNIISLGHTSVLAHASASFYIHGVSRSLAQELIRSRFLAFSEISQRYVDVNTLGWVYPPDADDKQRDIIDNAQYRARADYNRAFDLYVAQGYTRKEARGAARSVMPLSTETRILASGNMRAWRDFLWQRLNPAADKEIQNVAHLVLGHLRDVAPNTVQDITREYKDDSRLDRLRRSR